MPTYLLGPTRTYTTLPAVLAALPSSLPGTGIHIIRGDPGDYILPSGVQLGPLDGNASNYVQFEAAAGGEWNGLPSTGVRLLYSGASLGVAMVDLSNYARLVNIVVIDSGAGSAAVVCRQNSLCQNVYAKGLFGFVVTSSGGATAKCCVAQSTGAGSFTIGFSFGSGINAAYNCNSYGFVTSFFGNSSSRVVNCCGARRTGGVDFDSFSTTLSSNNASTDATAPGANFLRNQTLGAFGFADAANGNFHISTASVLRSAGTDASAFFTQDFDNQDILAPYPIGPDARNAAIGVDIGGTGFRFRQWPTFSISPAILWVDDSAEYPNGSDRGATRDAYLATVVFHGREPTINNLELTLDANRETVSLSNFSAPIFAPNVDHTGTINAVVKTMKRTQVQWGAPSATNQIYELEVVFRAITPPLLATTPSLASLRVQDGFEAGHSYTSPKAFTYNQAAVYGDRRTDEGAFEAPFSQKTAEAQAILAYLLITARANSFAFPAALATVAYPWGRARGAPANCKVTGISGTRKNLNRWTLKIKFAEAP